MQLTVHTTYTRSRHHGQEDIAGKELSRAKRLRRNESEPVGPTTKKARAESIAQGVSFRAIE
eukprot:3750165-Pleurochrysis_carterae.AAC.1